MSNSRNWTDEIITIIEVMAEDECIPREDEAEMSILKNALLIEKYTRALMHDFMKCQEETRAFIATQEYIANYLQSVSEDLKKLYELAIKTIKQ